MQIRLCNKADAEKVYNLICELENINFDYKDFEIAFIDKISDIKNYYIIGYENTNIVAFLSLNINYQLHHVKKIATIEELIVSNNYRNNGIGKQLLDNAIDYAKKNDCDVIELTSNFSRERAHNFYIKNAFNKTSYKFVLKL